MILKMVGKWMVYLIILIVIFSIVLDYLSNDPDVSTTGPSSQPNLTLQDNLPPIINASNMELIIPDELPGNWKYVNNHSKDGEVNMIFSKSGTRRVTIKVYDKRTEQMALYTLTPDNFSATQGSITWELSQTKRHKKDAMKGTYMDDDTLMGEMIAYPHDRYLVVAYILGENNKIVNMDELLDSLEFE
ncbi:MAG: hypothetical protein M8349_08890 [ANME-2 cluster archaeon]|nr:hypothetical protein [ANME-2 cluster archaeon]